MTEYDYTGDIEAQAGLEHLQEETKRVCVGLEYFRDEIAKKGFNRDLHMKVSTLAPGTFAGIKENAVPVNHGPTYQAVAVEAIDMQVAKLIGAGAVAGLATGGVGVMIYKFVKWVRSKLNSGAGTVDDATLSTAESKVKTEDAAAAQKTAAEKGKDKVESADSSIKGKFDHLSENTAKVAHYFAHKNASSLNSSGPIVDAIGKSHLAETNPTVACFFLGKSGLHTGPLAAEHYKIDAAFVVEARKYFEEVLHAFKAMNDFMADPSEDKAEVVVSKSKNLADAHSFGSRLQVAISEFGTEKAAKFNQRVGYFHAIDKEKVPFSPDDSAVKDFVDFILSEGYNKVCQGISEPYRGITGLLATFEASGTKIEKEITEADIKAVNEKAKENTKLKEGIKAIQQGVSNSLKLKQILNRYINSVAVLKEQLTK